MAKKGIDLPITLMSKDGKLFPRKAHNARNAHNAERNSCIANRLRGRTGGGKAAQQQRFREAAAACR